MRVIEASRLGESLELNWPLVADFLTRFIREELAWRGYEKAIVAVSGGVDSATTLALAVRALGQDRVHALFLPHRDSSPLSREHAYLVAETFGVALEEVDITPMVEAYAALTPDLTPHRKGNVMARTRMMVLFDKSQAYQALPLGTGNKTERLFGYYTWHGDDTPPVNPLGDLYKTQVWALARFLGVPEAVVAKPPTADLIPGQTDEADLGVRYLRADCHPGALPEGLPRGLPSEPGLHRGGDPAGQGGGQPHPLEAGPAHRGPPLLHGHRGVLPEAPGLPAMSDQELKTYLSRAKTIAVLGAHKDPSRPAHYVPRYLFERGYRILPVNPRFAGEELFGEKVAASLLELQSPVDILDVFRPGEALMAHLQEILALRPGLVWLQSGIRNPAFEERVREAGIPLVADRCLMVEHRRLF
jgi:NAD+ synthase